jgi:hypothetical protein
LTAVNFYPGHRKNPKTVAAGYNKIPPNSTGKTIAYLLIFDFRRAFPKEELSPGGRNASALRTVFFEKTSNK